MATHKIRRGTTAIFEHTIRRGDAAQNLTGYTVWWTAKTSNKLPDDQAAISHSWSADDEEGAVGLSRTDPETLVVSPLASGLLYNELTPTETAALVTGRRYYYGLKAMTPTGKVWPLEHGTIEVEDATTQRLTIP